MKISICCENCGHYVDLLPVTLGKHVYVHRNLIEDGNFMIYEVEIDSDISLSLSNDFSDKLTDCSDHEDVTEILENIKINKYPFQKNNTDEI